LVVAASAESEDALDGEEFTNKIPQIHGGAENSRKKSKANDGVHEMCLIHLDFKHFHAAKE
jgi:hypothetical protein